MSRGPGNVILYKLTCVTESRKCHLIQMSSYLRITHDLPGFTLQSAKIDPWEISPALRAGNFQ